MVRQSSSLCRILSLNFVDYKMKKKYWREFCVLNGHHDLGYVQVHSTPRKNVVNSSPNDGYSDDGYAARWQ